MSDVNAAEQPQVEQPEPQEEEAPPFVDLDGLPDDKRKPIQDRINYLVRENKGLQRSFGAFREHNSALEAKLNQLSQTVTRKETDETMDSLRTQKVEALEKGDYQRVALLDEQIFDQKVKAQTPPQRQPEPDPAAVLDPADADAVLGWAREMDQNGNIIRPWAVPGHPLHKKLEGEATAVLADPRFNGLPARDILREVDRRMMGPARGNAPGVLAGSNRPAPRKDGGLTPDQKFVAQRMWPKLAPDEAHKKYQTQLKATR